MPGLGTSFGRGGATNPTMDLQHSDAILIMGSNMAECHPVAFRFVVQAKTRLDNPATIMHVDPRFTRTSALANVYAPLRAGTDIVFLGALIKFALDRLVPIFQKADAELDERERFHRDYIVHYTNAASLITSEFHDTEENEAAGLFAGFDSQTRRYDVRKWQYDTGAEPNGEPQLPGRISGTEQGAKPPSEDTAPRTPFSEIIQQLVAAPALRDASLQHERCVFQILRKHFARYTPQLVGRVCGTLQKKFLDVAQNLWDNSGPSRTSAVCYAVGWTQHTTGVQIIRSAAILQLLLGNIGRPGGGIVALRGHATIQGSTDIATLYDLQPGYLKTPNALRNQQHLSAYIQDQASDNSFWSNYPKFIVRAELNAEADTSIPDVSAAIAQDRLVRECHCCTSMHQFSNSGNGGSDGRLHVAHLPATRMPRHLRTNGLGLSRLTRMFYGMISSPGGHLRTRLALTGPTIARRWRHWRDSRSSRG